MLLSSMQELSGTLQIHTCSSVGKQFVFLCMAGVAKTLQQGPVTVNGGANPNGSDRGHMEAIQLLFLPEAKLPLVLNLKKRCT